MFLTPNAKNFHVQYPDVNRHWSPRSEDFAGADCLVTAMMRGWELGYRVVHETHMHGGARMVNIYRFQLRKGERQITMPVLENPYVTRLLFTSPFEIIQASEESGNEVAAS